MNETKWKSVSLPTWLWKAYRRRLGEFAINRDSRPDACWCPPGADLSDPAIWAMVALDWHSAEAKRKGVKSCFLVVTPDYEVLIVELTKFRLLAERCRNAKKVAVAAQENYDAVVREAGPDLGLLVKAISAVADKDVPADVRELKKSAFSAVVRFEILQKEENCDSADGES